MGIRKNKTSETRNSYKIKRNRTIPYNCSKLIFHCNRGILYHHWWW